MLQRIYQRRKGEGPSPPCITVGVWLCVYVRGLITVHLHFNRSIDITISLTFIRLLWVRAACSFPYFFSSLSIRRFWGKGGRWKRERKRAEEGKRLTKMLLLEPCIPTHHDSIPSNQNLFRSLGCQLYVSKSSPKINLTLRSGRAPVLVLLRFRFFLKPPMRSFWILVMKQKTVFEEL